MRSILEVGSEQLRKFYNGLQKQAAPASSCRILKKPAQIQVFLHSDAQKQKNGIVKINKKYGNFKKIIAHK